jgi:hypothetical protein
LDTVSDLYAWARWAIAQGWYIAPSEGKISLGWQKLLSNDPDQIRDWFSEGLIADTTTGYAVCLKKSSLMVIDVDHPEVPLPGELPPTLTVETSGPGKRHFYYRDAAGNSRQLKKHPSGWGDFKGAHGVHGGYVIGPGSGHPSGAFYRLCDPALAVADEWPQWAVEWARQAPSQPSGPVGTATPVGLEEMMDDGNSLVAIRRCLDQLASIKAKGDGSGRHVAALGPLGELARIALAKENNYTAKEIIAEVAKVLQPVLVKRHRDDWELHDLKSSWKYVMTNPYRSDL